MSAAPIDHDLLEPLIAPLARLPVEVCVTFYLGAHHRLVGVRHIRGTANGVDIPPRLLVADALAFDARAAIMAHNHPSGDTAPSDDDLAVTIRLALTFEAVGVRLLDHVVLAGAARTSLRAAGFL